MIKFIVDFEINLANIALLIQSTKGEWCSIFLKRSDEIIKLGEEDQFIFLERLFKLFNYELVDVIGQVENVDVSWVASLAESHCTIYAGINGDNLCIFFQYQSGEIFERIELDRFEVNLKLEQIKAIINGKEDNQPSGS